MNWFIYDLDREWLEGVLFGLKF